MNFSQQTGADLEFIQVNYLSVLLRPWWSLFTVKEDLSSQPQNVLLVS